MKRERGKESGSKGTGKKRKGGKEERYDVLKGYDGKVEWE